MPLFSAIGRKGFLPYPPRPGESVQRQKLKISHKIGVTGALLRSRWIGQHKA